MDFCSKLRYLCDPKNSHKRITSMHIVSNYINNEHSKLESGCYFFLFRLSAWEILIIKAYGMEWRMGNQKSQGTCYTWPIRYIRYKLMSLDINVNLSSKLYMVKLIFIQRSRKSPTICQRYRIASIVPGIDIKASKNI